MHTSWPTNGVHTPRTQLAYITHTEEACAWDHAIGCIDETKTSRPSTGTALQLERRAAARAGLTPRCRWQDTKKRRHKTTPYMDKAATRPKGSNKDHSATTYQHVAVLLLMLGCAVPQQCTHTAIRCMHQIPSLRTCLAHCTHTTPTQHKNCAADVLKLFPTCISLANDVVSCERCCTRCREEERQFCRVGRAQHTTHATQVHHQRGGVTHCQLVREKQQPGKDCVHLPALQRPPPTGHHCQAGTRKPPPNLPAHQSSIVPSQNKHTCPHRRFPKTAAAGE